jgi:hypothetical protein
MWYVAAVLVEAEYLSDIIRLSLAVIISSLHFALFRFLDGKQADGSRKTVSQSYVSTASNILAFGFQLCLQLSLGTVFVQYL